MPSRNPLQPMTLGDLLDRAVALCRALVSPLMSSLSVIYGCSLAALGLVLRLFDVTVVDTPLWLLPAYLGNHSAFFLVPSQPVRALAGSWALACLGLVVVQSWWSALIIPLLARQHLASAGGDVPHISPAVALLRLLWPHAALFALTGLGALLCLAVDPASITYQVRLRSAFAGVQLVRLLLAIGLFVLVSQVLYSRLMLAPSVVLLERAGGLASLRRSWVLTRAAWPRAAALALAVYGASALLIFLPELLLRIGDVGGLRFELIGASSALVWTAMFGVALVLPPLQAAATTLLYYDLRVRHEGYDLERRLSSAPQ